MNLSSTQLRMLGSVMYFAAVVLIINYFAQFVITVWPLKVSELNWRVGASGLFMDGMLATVIPQAMLFLAAFLNNDRKILQTLRWLMIVLGVLMIGLLLLFALDSVQIRAQLPQNIKGNFLRVALRAAMVATLLSTLFVWLGLTMGKVLKSQGTVRTAGGAASQQEGMLMVGTREPARPVLRAVDTKESKKDGTSGQPIDA